MNLSTLMQNVVFVVIANDIKDIDDDDNITGVDGSPPYKDVALRNKCFVQRMTENHLRHKSLLM